MQTFLPYESFSESARTLDRDRLGKQRVENLQIMQWIFGQKLITKLVEYSGRFDTVYYDLEDQLVHEEDLLPGVEYHAELQERITITDLPEPLWHVRPILANSYSRHPAVRMWVGYIPALLSYQRAICGEWIARGYDDSCLRKCEVLYQKVTGNELPHVADMPPWMGDARVHISHRSRLIQKDARYYRPQFRGAPDDLEYYWPV